jgi:segregation and condensation protein B
MDEKIPPPAAEEQAETAPDLETPGAATAEAAQSEADFLEQLTSDSTTVGDSTEAGHLAVLEAIVYITDEPLSAQQIAAALGQPLEEVKARLEKLVAEYQRPEHGLMVREIAGGYKMTTKPEHHEAVRTFVKNLNPPLKLSLAALETLAVIAYKQPITAPEIMEIRGVQGAGVLNTLLNRKLITTAGRKAVVGRPILYRTTKEFLVQFGLKDVTELPTLKEFEELRRLALGDEDEGLAAPEAVQQQQPEDPESPPAPPEPQPELPASPEPEPESPGRADPDPESPAPPTDPEQQNG